MNRLFLIVLVCSISIMFSFHNAFAFDTSHLVEYYQSNQTVGTTIIDNCKYTTSGVCYNNDLSGSGSPTCQQAGLIDSSCFIEGSNPRFTNFLMVGNANYTVNGWIMKDSYHAVPPQDTGINNIFSSRSQASNANALFCSLNDDNTISCGVFNNAGNAILLSASTTSTIPDNVWSMITLQIKHANGLDYMYIYVNATLQASGNTASAIAYGQGTTLGNRAGGGGGVQDFSLKGYEDEFSVFSTVLSSSQLTQLYNNHQGLNLITNGPVHVSFIPKGVTQGNVVGMTECYDIKQSGVGVTLQQLFNNGFLVDSVGFSPTLNPPVGSIWCPYTFYELFNPPANYTVVTTFNDTTIHDNGTGFYFTSHFVPSNYVPTSLNYTVHRTPDFTKLILTVNRLPIPFNLECAIVNGTFIQHNHWHNYSKVGFVNFTQGVPYNENAYYMCFGSPPPPLFSGISFGNGTAIVNGIVAANASLGVWIGVPAGTFFIALVGSLANKRTGSQWAVILLSMISIMALIGFFTLDPKVWGACVVTGMLALLLGRKIDY